MGKITRMREFTDITIALCLLGLTGVMLGSIMMYAGVSCYLSNVSMGVGITNVIFESVIHGFAFIICGLSLMALCSFTILPVISKRKVDILWVISIISMLVSAVGLIRDVVLRRDSFSMIVSVITLLICAVIFYMINFTKVQLGRKLRASQASKEQESALEKVG